MSWYIKRHSTSYWYFTAHTKMCARELLLLRAFMKDPVITKDLTGAREQAVTPSLSGKICSCGGKM